MRRCRFHNILYLQVRNEKHNNNNNNNNNKQLNSQRSHHTIIMMKAIGYSVKDLPAKDSLVMFETPKPTKLGERDVLVRVKGVSVNPVDVKVRSWFGPDEGQTHKILGYDAAGIVVEVGSAVQSLAVGDEIYYSGEFTKPGTNSQFHVVDERLAGRKPTTLSFAESAALPLTSITAWELLFDSLQLQEGDGKGESVLVLGAAGGVGSILIQLAKKMTKLTVITTASRPDTIDWVKKMGADHVVNHRESLVEQIDKLDLNNKAPKYVIGLNGTEQHFGSIVELIQPRGHIAIIDDPKTLDIAKFPTFKLKALSFSWEFMFARSMFQTDDMDAQQKLLNRVAEMVDDGTLVSTTTQNLGPLTVESLMKAHELQESGKVFGKNVLEVDW